MNVEIQRAMLAKAGQSQERWQVIADLRPRPAHLERVVMERIDPSALAPGALVAERFLMEHLVARGGMGTIYKAIDRLSGRPVALKILSLGHEQPQDAARFEQEASVLASLSHPRIVAHVAHGRTEEGLYYLGMEWLDGHDLGRRLTKGPLSLRECKMLLEKTADALAQVHARGVVHRDIKPANLFLRGGNIEDPMLVDFGIARGTSRSAGLTLTGTVLGTPNYMSPEQARGSAELTPASDIFSLGCVFYECLTGASPFAADHVAAVLAKILFDRPRPAAEIRPSIPEAYSELLACMLRKDPNVRPQNAGILLQDLSRLPEPFAEGSETMPSIVPPPNSNVMGTERSLVSVVLCTPLDSGPRDAPQKNPTGDHFHSIKMQLSRFGADIDQMADGSLLATVIAKGSAVDQARIAARCAIFLRDVLHNDRISVATGRGQWQGTMPVGEAVERAAGLLRGKVTESGIYLDEVTAGLLGGRFEVKAIQTGVFSLLAEQADGDTGRLLLGRPTPCVGREPELSHLEAIWERSIGDGVSNAIVLLGPAGIGKSRIRMEFSRRLREKHSEARVLSGFGDPLSAGSPYGLLGQALRSYAGIQAGSPPEEQREKLLDRLCASIEGESRARVAEFLGELCGVPFPDDESPMLLAARRDPKAMSEQIQHAFLDFITTECSKNPMVIMLEDLQWGDALTIQLLDAVLRERNEIPLLVMAFARPELSEAHPALFQGIAQEIPLRPLNKKVCERYTEEMLGEKKLSPEALSVLVQRSAGNPLFLEELIRAAAEGRADEIPETVLAMLQARLSRLGLEARRLLRSASIFGETFWAGGVASIVGNAVGQTSLMQWLDMLVKSEWIERRRQSQFENETEYAFRHAIARDAAYSLLTEAELQAGHQQAFLYLEGAGERDCMVLAGHAERGKQWARAVELYMQAAEESLKRNDLAEAQRRAELGMGCGAEGEQKGVLRAVQALASYGLADWGSADKYGTEALQLVPRGRRYWFQVAERMLHFLPTIGQIDRFEDLAAEIEEAEPMAGARPAQLCAIASLVGVYGLVGDRERAQRYVDRIDQIKGALLEEDPYVNGVVHLYMAWLGYFLQPNPYSAFIHGQTSEQMFMSTGVLHSLSFARSVVSALRALLGDYEGAEVAIRSAIDVATQIRDSYMSIHSRIYLAHFMVRICPLESLDEICAMAKAMLENPLSDSYRTTANAILAYAHLRWGRTQEAAGYARAGCQLSAVWPPGMLLCSSVLIDALARERRWDECMSAATEGMAVLGRLGGVGVYEIPFRAAAADAFLQAGKREEGIALLRETLQEIDKRASKIEDPFLKNCYLHQNIDNLRVFKLAQQWVPEDLQQLRMN